MNNARDLHGGGAVHASDSRHMTGRAWLAVLVGVVAVAGCAPSLVAVKDPTQRLEMDGVSFLPPPGQTWYVASRDSRRVLFTRRPPEPPHTVVAMAAVEKIEIGGVVSAPIRNTQDLTEVLERKLRLVGGRFVTIESSIRPAPTLGVECARADLLQEERDNPRVPGVVLVMVGHELHCVHPRSPGYVVWFSYSERYPRGRSSFSAETLRAEAESFMRSATFTPIR